MSYLPRLGALVAASALAVTGITLVAAPAQAAPDLRPQSQSAEWLIGQLTNGVLHNPLFDFDDFGLSADTAFALDTLGGHDSTVQAIGNAVRDHYYDYVTSGPFGPNDLLAGQMGKALVLAQVAGTLPDVYQSRVVADLNGRVATVAPIVGRIENRAGFDANVVGQIFAARGLTTAGSDLADEALAFLLAQQCADGHFREKFSPKDAVDQSCAGGVADTTGDAIGTTAMAVINLQEISGATGVAAAMTSARAWLLTQQNANGSFGTGTGNANNTGLAAQALGASPQATQAATWLRDHQADDTDACTKLAGNIGAVGLNDAAVADGRAGGINDLGEWQRATSEVIVALGFLQAEPAATLNITGPTGYAQASKAASYSVTGAVPGSKLCLTVASNSKAATANGAGVASAALTLPAGTGIRTITVTDRNGHTDTVATKVLGVKTLTVKPAIKRVAQGEFVKVTVSGLAASEAVTLRYRGVVVATGKATTAGTFVRYVKVGRKLGSAAIAATGQFPTIRKGATTITVVR